MGKGENAGLYHCLLSTMFSKVTFFQVFKTWHMYGNKLTLFKKMNLRLKLKAFLDDSKLVFGGVENRVGKQENVKYKRFLPWQQCFKIMLNINVFFLGNNVLKSC